MENKINIREEIENYIQNNELDFTMRAKKLFDKTTNLNDFADKDADYIYDRLANKLHPVSFGDYLKRYIHKQSKMSGKYENVDIKDYQEIIIQSFKENETPPSFTETTAKIGNLAKNWLKQASVKRQIIFLLGFGLNMDLKDVSKEFLLKAQGEHDFNFKDPIEIIYWYCFKNGFGFSKMLKLKAEYESLPAAKNADIYGEVTIRLRDKFRDVSGDGQFLDYLADFKTEGKSNFYSVTAYKWFDELYSKCKKIVADIYNRREEKKLEKETEKYIKQNKGSWELSEADKEANISKMRENIKKWTVEDVTGGEFEKFLYKGTSIDEFGKLPKFTDSTLSEHFVGKILNRQHLWEIAEKKSAADRFDLITLNFFIFSLNGKYKGDNKRRFEDFQENTNKILRECSMGELYIANSYECFLLMCIVSDLPFAAYTEVLGQAFESVHREE
jgi:hypothetical protein